MTATPGPTTQSYLDQAAGSLRRLARSERGWSQRRFADAAGVPVSSVARIESGTRQPSLLPLFRLPAAADRELRFDLTRRDDHDDVLDAPRAMLTDAREQHTAPRASTASADPPTTCRRTPRQFLVELENQRSIRGRWTACAQ